MVECKEEPEESIQDDSLLCQTREAREITKKVKNSWKRSVFPGEGQVMKCEEELISCIQDASLLPLA